MKNRIFLERRVISVSLLLLFANFLLSIPATALFLEIGPLENRQPQRVIDISAIPAPSEDFNYSKQRAVTYGQVNPSLAATLQQTLESFQVLYGATGLSAAMALPDGSVWEGAAGINSKTPNEILHPGLVLGIGSVSKIFTSATVLHLYEAGLLKLDDQLNKWLPPYPNIDSTITIRQLLNHTSGIGNYTANSDFWEYTKANLGQIIKPEFILENYIGTPMFSPGASWGYSNTNYLLLGLIIEAASGNAYHLAVRNRLLVPQGLNTLSLYPQEESPFPLAHLWFDVNSDGNADDFTAAGNSLNSLFSSAWASGAYLSTASDMAGWIRQLMMGQVLQPSTLQEMKTTVQISPTFRYGLGLYQTVLEGKTWWGHDGYIYYQALVLYQPRLDIGIALLSNDGEFEHIWPAFLRLITAYENYLEKF